MKDLETSLAGLTLVCPNPERDTPYALKWFTAPYGKDTLLRMGNLESEINEPTPEHERATIEEFLTLEQQGKQLTWAMQIDNKIIGAVWIELIDTDHVKAPAAHIMIGDMEYRGQGIGTASMSAMADYTRTVLHSQYLYSRHLVTNHIISKLNTTLGFEVDGEPYQEPSGLIWQNVKLALA